jgi:hypothetical protein
MVIVPWELPETSQVVVAEPQQLFGKVNGSSFSSSRRDCRCDGTVRPVEWAPDHQSIMISISHEWEASGLFALFI